MNLKILLFSFILLFSCDIKPKSIGPYDRVIVFGNTDLYEMTIDSIRKYMGDERELPIREYMFEYEYRSIKDFKKFRQYRNIMFLISNESENEYNQLTEALLSSQAKQGVEDNQYNMFLTKDLYAENQSVLILAANKDSDLKEVIGEQVNRLTTYDDFKASVMKRYSDEVVYGYNHVEATAQSLMRQHGYSIDHSKFYKAFDNKTGVDSNIVSFFAPAPLRYYFVKFYEDVEDKSISGYLDLRDLTHKMHFEGDLVDRENQIYVDTLIVNDLEFIKIQSTYMTFDEDGRIIGGGPCITYILNDGNRTYILDGSVFKPGNRKSMELLQLEIIMRTFQLGVGDTSN
jgi:hypothetical protein